MARRGRVLHRRAPKINRARKNNTLVAFGDAYCRFESREGGMRERCITLKERGLIGEYHLLILPLAPGLGNVSLTVVSRTA